MARFSGRRVTVGIKKEASRGTAETSGFYYYPFLSAEFTDKTEKKFNESSYGNIVKNNDEITVMKNGEGSLEGKIFAKGIGHLLTYLFGTAPTTTANVGDDTGAHQHVFNLANNNVHQSFTSNFNDTIANVAFALSMIDSLKITWVKDDFSKVEITTQSKESVSSSATASFSVDTEFLPKHVVIKLADALAGLTAADEADDITSITVEFKKNLTVTQTSASKEQVDDIHNTDFEISGSIEKYYSDSVYKGYGLDDTKKAMRLAFIDNINLSGSETPTSLTFDLAKVSFKNHKPAYGNSDIATETIDFEGLFSLTDSKAVTATLVNEQASY